MRLRSGYQKGLTKSKSEEPPSTFGTTGARRKRIAETESSTSGSQVTKKRKLETRTADEDVTIEKEDPFRVDKENVSLEENRKQSSDPSSSEANEDDTEGNEIVPLTSETQIALPSTGDGSLVAPSQSEVVIAGGNYVGAVFGSQTNKKVLKAKDYRNAKITTIHHHHYPATERSQESPSTSNATGAKQIQKPASEEDVLQISDDLFMYSNQLLQEGTDVYKGYQIHASGDQRPLAIKRIVPCEDSHLREVKHLLALASHPNVVQIIQSKEHKYGGHLRTLYIAMELCSSQNLQGYLDKNREENIPFDFDQTMLFTKQLVSGMKHIHVNKVAHRDLKPENILISEDGEHIKVSDFGLSKRLRLGKSQTRQTRLGVGTDGYRAPETFVSETIGLSADIFSLGAIIYSMWSNGNHPFGNNVYLVNNNIIKNEGRDLSGLLISGTKENQLHNLVDWMLHPDPKKRPTIEQVAQHPFFKSGPSSAAEDNSNQASSSEQTGEKSSPRTPSSNISAEHSGSTTQFSAATQSNSPKEDPNNRSNLRQQQVEKLSLKQSAAEKTLTQQSVSKKVKVPSKEGIVIFDEKSKHLQLFNPADNTLTQRQSFNEDMKPSRFTAVTLHDFVYVLMENKSVLRLEYSDNRAIWEPMSAMIDEHGLCPPATVMSGCIYVAGAGAGGNWTTVSYAMEKFDPSTKKWSSLKEKEKGTTNNELVVAQGCIYSIGGFSNARAPLKEVERFDPVSSTATWAFVAPMKQARCVSAAVEFSGKIFVLGGSNGGEFLSSVEIYDPSTDMWSAMNNNMLTPRAVFSAFVINGDIYAVGGDKEWKSIERYSFERDVWEEVQIQTKRKINICASTKIQI